MSQVHHLKTDIDMFTAVVQSKKTYEIRLDDRGFEVGDTLFLKETLHTGDEMRSGAPLVYTGRGFQAKIKHILRGPIYGLMKGWVILSMLEETADEDQATLEQKSNPRRRNSRATV